MEQIDNARKIEAALQEIRALAARYKRCEVAEYQGQLHIRVGRRVVAVVDYLDGWLRVNELSTSEQRSRVNDVLSILGSNLRVNRATVNTRDGIELYADVWEHHSSVSALPVVRSNREPRSQLTFTLLLSPLAALWPGQPARVRIVDNLRDIEAEGVV